MPASNNIGFSKPEWLICGGQLLSGGVRVLASKSLTKAELDIEYKDLYSTFPGPVFINPMSYRPTIKLHAEFGWNMDDSAILKLVDAPDYLAAFKALFESWTPESEPLKAISQGQPQLEQ